MAYWQRKQSRHFPTNFSSFHIGMIIDVDIFSLVADVVQSSLLILATTIILGVRITVLNVRSVKRWDNR